jgi:hypothetical protein
MEAVPILILVGLGVAAAVVTALKGKPWFLVIGFFISWFWVFGSLRLAKPDSWWGRRFYEGTKLAESKLRFNTDGGYDAAPAYDPTRY